jgi:guanylate kinase
MANSPHGRIVVISGPSGVGKTTVLRRLRECAPVPLAVSVSATTRPPRSGEIDGVHYYFLSAEEFARRRRRGDFLECFEVFGRGYWYGTPWEEVRPRLQSGEWVVLGIDVHGADAVVDRFPDAVTIFLRPGSLEQLERQLRGRHTETEPSIQRRLEEARDEMARAARYQHQVVNDSLDRAVGEICDILARCGENIDDRGTQRGTDCQQGRGAIQALHAHPEAADRPD